MLYFLLRLIDLITRDNILKTVQLRFLCKIYSLQTFSFKNTYILYVYSFIFMIYIFLHFCERFKISFSRHLRLIYMFFNVLKITD